MEDLPHYNFYSDLINKLFIPALIKAKEQMNYNKKLGFKVYRSNQVKKKIDFSVDPVTNSIQVFLPILKSEEEIEELQKFLSKTNILSASDEVRSYWQKIFCHEIGHIIFRKTYVEAFNQALALFNDLGYFTNELLIYCASYGDHSVDSKIKKHFPFALREVFSNDLLFNAKIISFKSYTLFTFMNIIQEIALKDDEIIESINSVSEELKKIAQDWKISRVSISHLKIIYKLKNSFNEIIIEKKI